MAKKQVKSLSLKKLINQCAQYGLQCKIIGSNQDINISGISQDSRNVEKGYIFVALRGITLDGTKFIPQAIANGAVAVLCDESDIAQINVNYYNNIIFIVSQNPRLYLSILAANFYEAQPSVIVAVTGTNGKTSTAYFCKQMWQLLGKESASIGTIGIATNAGLVDTATGSMTTPDPIKLHEILANLANDGVGYLAMEASSHGLDQYRLDGVRIKSAAFTNITRDHLDYHKSFENYLQAKLRLFDIMKNGAAVINADIPEANSIIKLCKSKGHEVLSIGRNGGFIKITNIEPKQNSQLISFDISGKEYKIHTNLIGEFQAYNLLTSLALLAGSGEEIQEVINILEQVGSVPGRMQGVTNKTKNLMVYVDYAHTPDALEKAIQVLRPYTRGNLWVVFGCGGDRDKGKRPQMGKVAINCADKIIVTDDNPRTEQAADIRRDILVSCNGAIEIADRQEAIKYAIRSMQQGDSLLIAGKGHEKYQIIGDKETPFDDVEVAIEFMKTRKFEN